MVEIRPASERFRGEDAPRGFILTYSTRHTTVADVKVYKLR